MNKITIVIPKKKAEKVEKALKKLGIDKFIKLPAGRLNKYEVFVTDLITQKTVNTLKKTIKIGSGKSAEEGYLSVNPTRIIAPTIVEKGKDLELEEVTKIGAKKFVQIDRDYLLFTVCSAILACIGFIINNTFALLGAMLISPLMASIMSVSYGLSIKDNKLVINGLKTETIGVIIIVLIALLMNLFPNPDLSMELSSAESNLLFIFLISIIVGVVAANSFITGRFEALTGVAVGISLLPPLINFIILIFKDQANAFNSLLLFVSSIIGMHLSAFLYFAYMNRKNNNK
jgi:uncharacterized hydrophobic protein (TIGR00341 family)